MDKPRSETSTSPSPLGTRKSKLEYERPWMAPYQTRAIFNDARYSIIEATTKAGKTAGCLVWLMEQAFLGLKNDNYWWVAPVNTQTDVAFQRMRDGLPREIYHADLTHKVVTLITGAKIWFKSADNPDSLFGDDVKAAVIDEASRIKMESWHAIRTTLTATKGKLRIIGNVKGRKNWFFDMARSAELGNDPTMHYDRMTAYDAIAAGILDGEEIEDARRKLPDRVFRELYLAEPADDGGNPFDLSAIRACVAGMSDGKPQVWGWDLAKHVDWTVGIALDREGKVCRFVRFQKPWGDTIEQINRYTGKTPALVDSTGVGDPILEMLQKEVGGRYEGYNFNSSSKQRLMEGLAAKIQSQEIAFPDGPIRVELESFEYEYTRTGVRYSAPEGASDDCVMALALAVMHSAHARPAMQINPAVLAAAHGQANRFTFNIGASSGHLMGTKVTS